MFEVLVESGARRRTALGPRIASVSLHAMVLVVAGMGWRQAAGDPSLKPQAVPIEIFHEPSTSPVSAADGSAAAGTSGKVLDAPSAPVDVPSTIPTFPVEPIGPQPSVEIRGLVRRELWGDHRPGVTQAWDSLRLAGEVDEPVVVLTPKMPVYPAALAAAGVPGVVQLEFVVDTSGRGEPGSVRVISSTTLAFEQPAIDAVLGTEYRAARVSGHRVRQLVHQRVAFRTP